MATYEVTDLRVGLNLGTFEAETCDAALEAMAIDAGYDTLDELCRRTGADPEHFDVLCVMPMGGAS